SNSFRLAKSCWRFASRRASPRQPRPRRGKAIPTPPARRSGRSGRGGRTELLFSPVWVGCRGCSGIPFDLKNVLAGGVGRVGRVGGKVVGGGKADGYTLLFSSPGPLVTAAAVYRNLDYDPIKSFAPIAMVIYAPQMLVVHPSVAAESLPELVAYAKR